MFRLAIQGVCNFQVEEGRRILVEPEIGAPLDKVRLFLLGSAMGALLYQRGMFPLHGCTVVTQWGAMIFVGAQGVGKSTLGAHFRRNGYALLSDDVSAVIAGPKELEVLPALAHFRLCADAFERLGAPDEGKLDVDKFVVPMDEGYYRFPVPLKAIHVLADHENGDPKFEILCGLDRIRHLLENLYRPQYLMGQKTQGDLLRLAGRIAESTSIVMVSRKRDTGAIDEFVSFMELAWREHFDRNHIKEQDRCVTSERKTN
jgi:hypothetical protein